MTAGPIANAATRAARPTAEREAGARVILVIAVLNVVAVAAYAVVAIRFGFFEHLSASLFWSPDSGTYRDVGRWLLGAAPNTLESQHRPFLYPLLLAVADKVAGDPGVWILNLACWFGMLNLTAAALLRLTGRIAIAAIGFLALITSASLIVLTFQALTESLTAFLLAVWILGLAAAELPPTKPRDFAMLLFPLALLTVVRPQFEIEFAAAFALLAIVVWRRKDNRLRLGSVVVACCVPVVFQVGLMSTANHFVGISDSGSAEFKSYYVSQVYASINGLPDDLVAARTVVGGWTYSHAFGYLLDHPRTAAYTLVDNLHRNLTSGSNFVTPAQSSLLASAIRETNRLYLKIHAAFLPVVLLALWRRRDLRLLLLYAFAVLLTLTPSLIVDQGDRYIEVVLPLWVAAYGLAVADLLPDLSRIFQRWQGTTS